MNTDVVTKLNEDDARVAALKGFGHSHHHDIPRHRLVNAELARRGEQQSAPARDKGG